MKYLYILTISLLLSGCIDNPKAPLQVKNLEQTILSISSSIKKSEAKKLSSEMIKYSSQLKDDYELVSPPLFHNFLVNTGIKKRGLCWHFAYDMLARAKSLNLDSFDYYVGGANISDYWQEHNTLVATCKDCSFNKGVVLDPWRNSGDLYFSKIKDDKSYAWTQRGGLR